MRSLKTLTPILLLVMILAGCKAWEEEFVNELKQDLSIEYDVSVTDIEIDVVEYGTSIFTTNQLKVSIESKEVFLYFIQKGGSTDYIRIPIK